MNSINNVGTDYLVRRHWEIQDAKVYSGARLLRQADASSFETQNYLYARDAARVYYSFGTIDEADPSSFEVLDSGAQSAGAGKSLLSFSGFARDKNNVYHYR